MSLYAGDKASQISRLTWPHGRVNCPTNCTGNGHQNLATRMGEIGAYIILLITLIFGKFKNFYFVLNKKIYIKMGNRP